MRIWFDMDGTIADLYAVENWREKLHAFDPSPYEEAKPLFRMCSLAKILNRLSREGVEIGIVSWISRNATEAYAEKVIAAKKEWLAKHLPSVKWDSIVIVPSFTPKSKAANIQPHDILFDDEERNVVEWEEAGGWAFDPSEMMDFLRAC